MARQRDETCSASSRTRGFLGLGQATRRCFYAGAAVGTRGDASGREEAILPAEGVCSLSRLQEALRRWPPWVS